MAKAGIDALSASVTLEYGPLGVTSNVIAPGPIAETEGMDRLAGDGDMDTIYRRVPAGRWGLVKEIADATVFLFSDAGNFVNGDELVVDGGAWRGPNAISTDYPSVVLGGLKNHNRKPKPKL